MNKYPAEVYCTSGLLQQDNIKSYKVDVYLVG